MLTACAAARWFSFIRNGLAVAVLVWMLEPAGGAPANSNLVEIIVIQGVAEVARSGQTVWDLASTQLPYRQLYPGDQIRTKNRSRASIRLSDLTLIELGPNAHFQLLGPEQRRPGFSLQRGLLHLFHRNKPGEFYFRTPTASPVIRGTEFNLEVAETGDTTLQLLEGEAALSNRLGQVVLQTGEAASAGADTAPVRIAALPAINLIQWCLYYPAVLHLEEIGLPEPDLLAESLEAYRQGDLLRALSTYPAARQPGSNQEKIYLAGLLLAVGEVGEAEAWLQSLERPEERSVQLAEALRTLIAAVQNRSAPVPATNRPPQVSRLLAHSYYLQSRFDLEGALEMARAATQRAPDFAFAWARVAELEFSFGRTSRALEAVNRAAQLAPRHAQALAVRGFLLAAENRVGPALGQFEAALAVDGALGNAWLGRGLCLIRQGHLRAGTGDLLVAAALEPNRALARSYLGKAFAESGADELAQRELRRAQQLDPQDPTGWLYSALLKQRQNLVNDAIRELEHSQQLNDYRQLYRSRLLLDQDRAVGQANLASIYQDAGLFDHGVREAARAVSSDYANPSAHLFLANSYAQLRGVDSITLRYETVTLSEYLVASLLAPVGGTPLSPYVSQQEYSRLFQRDGLGLSSETEYLSRGDWRQRGAQYGRFQNLEYAVDAYYATQNGDRPNHDFSLLHLSAAIKFQVSPQDTIFLQAVGTEFESGDVRRLFDPSDADLQIRIEESQRPNLFAGYHRQWGPGSHSLLLVGRLDDNFRWHDSENFIPTLDWNQNGIFEEILEPFSVFNTRLHNDFVAWTAELQQIWQQNNHTLVVGGRYQDGEAQTRVQMTNVIDIGGLPYFPVNQAIESDLQRAAVYIYDYWQVLDRLCLVGGVTYDWLNYPKNIDAPPIDDGQTDKAQLSPKAGVIWRPIGELVLRGAYSRSLGGLYYDNSVRLEPAHLAGFNQAFRSLIPESLAGSVAGAEFETAGIDLSCRFSSGTYLGLGGEWLQSDAERLLGLFHAYEVPPPPVVAVSNTVERLDFEEKTLKANINQLVGRDWSLGAAYRLSHARLERRWNDVLDNLSPNAPPGAVPDAKRDDEGLLHQLILSAKFNHPSGFFFEFQSLWFGQQNPHLADDHFWQHNVFGGYRFAQRRVEVLLGGLNLSDQDYQLNPVNLYSEPPRDRTLLAAFKFYF